MAVIPSSNSQSTWPKFATEDTNSGIAVSTSFDNDRPNRAAILNPLRILAVFGENHDTMVRTLNYIKYLCLYKAVKTISKAYHNLP